MSTDPELPPEIVARPAYVDALASHPDRLGRRVLRRFSVVRLLSMFTSGDWQEIPTEYWALSMNDEGFSEAVVSCTCGHDPHVEVLCVRPCECHRWFAFPGDRVLVAYGEQIQAPDGA